MSKVARSDQGAFSMQRQTRLKYWSEREDLNLRPLPPEDRALKATAYFPVLRGSDSLPCRSLLSHGDWHEVPRSAA